LTFDTLESPTIPLPPPHLQVEVLGGALPADEFFYGGFTVAQGLREILAHLGRPLDSFESVLDLGCGCGRVLRWFEEEARTVRFHGSDISKGAIEWDRKHIPFARFDVNGVDPPLAHPDGAFDLAFAISVVTHLSEELQLAWLEELKRVLRPGGLLLMSVQGDDTSTQRLDGADLEAYRRKGHHFKRIKAGGLHGLPDFYQDAFHTREYVERVWSRFFRVKAYVRHGPLYTQDLVVMEKAPADLGDPILSLDLPVCSIGAPTLGSLVRGDFLPAFGSAFDPRRPGPLGVVLWVDGKRVGSVPAAIDSPAFAKAFPAWPSAARCTFEGLFPIKGLPSGPHVLRLSTGTDPVAGASTYFFTA
jgi:SAM-dependent methyltransferase